MLKNRVAHDAPRHLEARLQYMLGVVALSVLPLAGCGVSPAASDAREPRDIRPGIVCGLAMTGGHSVVCARGRTLVVDR